MYTLVELHEVQWALKRPKENGMGQYFRNTTLCCRITCTLLLNQSVAKPKTLNISTQTSHAIRFSFDNFSYLVVAVTLERVWVKKPGEDNKKAMSRCRGF